MKWYHGVSKTLFQVRILTALPLTDWIETPATGGPTPTVAGRILTALPLTDWIETPATAGPTPAVAGRILTALQHHS